jgi:hypothetical protein
MSFCVWHNARQRILACSSQEQRNKGRTLENLIGEFTFPGIEKRDDHAEGLDEGQRLSPGKSVSAYECFPFIWPYNALRADAAHRKRGSVTLPRVADKRSAWIAGP